MSQVSPSGAVWVGTEINIACKQGYVLSAHRSAVLRKRAAVILPRGRANHRAQHRHEAPSCRFYSVSAVGLSVSEGRDSASKATCVETDTGGGYDELGAECVAVCAAFPPVAHATVSPSGGVRLSIECTSEGRRGKEIDSS